MSESASQLTWLEKLKSGFETQNAPDVNAYYRQGAAIKALQSEPLPERKMERWRYTPVAELFKLPLALTATAPANESDFSGYFTHGLDAYRMLVVNGHASLLGSEKFPDGVHVNRLKQDLEDRHDLVARYLGKAMDHGIQIKDNWPSASRDSQVFQLMNQSISPDGLFVHLAEGVSLDKPVEVVFLHTSEQSELVQTHSLVVLEPGAEMTLVEKHIDLSADSCFSNNQFEQLIGNNAHLKHFCLQDMGDNSWHHQAVHRMQQENSRYNGWYGCFGGKWSRLEIDVDFSAEAAESHIKGIQLAGDGQLNDIHLTSNHAKPGCHSEQHFRGLANGKGKIVFDGNIIVAPDAQKTVAHLSDNNLMLSRNAEIDTKPQLEIYADDVQCSHGTSIGEIDEQQVFYLRSRGISEDQAIQLLSMGFVAELLDDIDIETVKSLFLNALESKTQAS